MTSPRDLHAITSAAIAAATSDATAHHLRRLFSGEGPSSPSAQEGVRARVDAILDRFRRLLAPLVEIALRTSIEADDEYLQRVRDVYLTPKRTYSFDDLATQWAVPAEEVRDMFYDELLAREESHPEATDDLRIAWADAVTASIVFGIVRPVDVELALGDDSLRVLPAEWRTVPILLHLPRFVTDAIAREAGADRTDILLPARIEALLLDLYSERLRALVQSGAAGDAWTR